MSRTAVTLACLAAVAVACGGDPAEYAYVERMAAEHAGDRPVASEAAAVEPAADIAAEEVTYARVGGREVAGFFARPAAGGPAPGVILIHEWWGLNDNIRAVARRLAGEGYAALAVDLYGGESAEDGQGARALMQAVEKSAAEENLRQAYAYLSGVEQAPRVGVVGWCFGGGWSLGTALLLPEEIDATVIYYGRLETDPERLAPLAMPILGIFGAEDQGIPVATVREFETALAELGKEATIHVYEGADHAFANPSGTRYNAAAAEDAWEKTLAFFAAHLKGTKG